MTQAHVTPAAIVREPVQHPGFDHVLIACLANQCRSPFAEAVGRQAAEGRAIWIESGGLLPGGRSMPAVGIDVAAERGLDLSAHRSRRIDVEALTGFDLVLTAAREQAREIVAANPELRPRVFTIKQFARWIAEHPRPRRAQLGSWLDVAADERPATDLLGEDPADDLEDPLLLPAEKWRDMADELDVLLPAIVNALRPARHPGTALTSD